MQKISPFLWFDTQALIIILGYLASLATARAQAPGANVGKPRGDVVVAMFAPKPDYTYFARTHHLEGSGVFQLRITAGGNVSSVETIQSTGYRELDDSTTKAFSRWHFRGPGRPTKVQIPITFSMHLTPQPLPGSTYGRGVQGIPHS